MTERTTAPSDVPGFTGPGSLRAVEDVPLHERDLALTTYDLLLRAAARWRDKPAGVWLADPAQLDRHTTTTFGSLLRRVHEIAHALHRLGVARDDAVTLLAPNCSDLLAATLAAEAVGIAAPVNPALDVEHLAHIVELTGSRVVVTAGPELDASLWTRLLDGAAELGLEVLVALSPDSAEAVDRAALETRPNLRAVRLEELVEEPAGGPGPDAGASLPVPPPRPDDLAAFFHTGGTTGAPKVAAHTHRNQSVMAWTMATAAGLEPGAGVVAGLPLFHVNALMVTALAPLVVGSRSIWPSPLGYRDPSLYAAFWRLVEHYRPAAMSAVPTVYAFLSSVPVDADISSLRLPIVGAAPLPDAVRDAFRDRTGLELHEGYGLTEATCATSVTPLGDPRPGSVGLRLPYQSVGAGEVDADGAVRMLPAGEVGELLISGPTVFAGYLRRSGGARVATAEGVVVEGWLRTGDLGRVIDERVYVHGRIKDLIIRGGHNIDPAVIEDALLAHPSVSAAGAVGRPDRSSGETPVAYVAADSRRVTVDELMAWAADHIAEPAARPKHITVLETLPVTAVGKPFKPALREDAALRRFETDLAEHGVDSVELTVTHRDGRMVARVAGQESARAAALDVLAGYDVAFQEVTE